MIFDTIQLQLGNAIRMAITTFWLALLLFIIYKIIDHLTPVNIREEIFEKQNIAAALFILGIWIAIAIAISI